MDTGMGRMYVVTSYMYIKCINTWTAIMIEVMQHLLSPFHYCTHKRMHIITLGMSREL